MANMAAFANNSALQDEASSASHASSSRLTSSMNTISSGSQSKIQYQPLSMADALARTGHDQVLALDQLLAERNKLCLEANKLSTENMRLWNMMKRIRRENEELKNNNTGTLRSSPLSNGSQVAGSNNAFPSSSSSATIAGAGTNLNPGSTSQSDALSSNTQTLSTSSTAPALSVQQASTNLLATDPSGNQLESQKSSLYGSAPSGTGHSISGEGSEPRGSFTSNEVQEQQSPSNIPATTSTATVHPDTASTTGPLNKSDTQGIGISTDSELANNQSSDSASHSQQHQSIMQQRAAAQAQRLAQIQSQKADDGARPSSTGSHDFDAVDASSMAGSEGARNSMRFSGDSGNNRGLQARVVPPSPLAISSPTMQSTSSGRQWSTESPRNSFSPRLDAGLLPFVNLSVSGSNLRASERGKEIVSFYIAIDVKPPQGRVPQYSSWRVEKTYSDVLNLDARIKQKHGKVVSKRMSGVQLPDQTLFKDHAPSKVDKRKAMLELYLRTLVTIPLPDKDDLCTFFCTDALQPKIREPDALTKEGFLTKKGQNLGRWVTRWYVLSETSLDHYEWRNGLHLGSINIRGAQIGRQQKSVATDTDENSYRHAFLILETKAPSSTGDQKQIIRHVLCAETDEERDDWVEVLVRAIGEADNRDSNSVGGVDPVNPYSSPIMPASATRSAFAHTANDPGATESPSNAPIQVDELRSPITGEEENLNTTAVIPKSPSALPSTTQRPSREYSPFAAAAAAPNSPHGVSPQISMPRSRSEVVGLQSSQEERSMRTRHANLAAITASPGQNTQSGQGYQSGNRNTINPGSPIRPPPRSTSQDVPSNGYGMVTSSSSIGHGGATYDNGTYRTSSPGIGGGGTGDERQSISSTVSRVSKDRARPSISGPMNGTPIPTGYKFGGKDEPSETPSNKPSGPVSSSKNDGPNAPNETKRRFWHRFGGGGDKSNQQRKVFGVPLAESIAVSNVSEGLELPSVVYRCIEYLEHHNAASEEGIYRLSGSSAVIKNLKDRFNAQGDVNLLASNEPFFDPHAIAGLLKQYLRELPSSVLTRELHLDFMRVNDLADRRERVNELGSLVSLLPLPNYSLLRTLCSHLIKVIERSDVNKMTMRNVGIVFSPTLGIPAGVFALFLTEFDWVFYTDAKGEPAPRTMEEDILPPDEDELGLANKTDGSPQGQQRQPHHQRNAGSFEDDFARKPAVSHSRNNRNSLSYNEMEADRLLGGPQARNRLSSYLEEVNGEGANAFDDAKNAQSYPDDGLEQESYEESQGASIGNEVQQNFKSRQAIDYTSSNQGHNGPANSHRLEGEITKVNQPYIRNTPMSPPQPSVRS